MTFLNSILNKSKKSNTPFEHWEHNETLSEGAIQEIISADIADVSQHNLKYDHILHHQCWYLLLVVL